LSGASYGIAINKSSILLKMSENVLGMLVQQLKNKNLDKAEKQWYNLGSA